MIEMGFEPGFFSPPRGLAASSDVPRRRIGQEFYAGLAEQQRLKLFPALSDGLLPNFTALQGEDFAPDQVCPEVRDFYKQTVGYRLEA